jgi:hypothetical protein
MSQFKQKIKSLEDFLKQIGTNQDNHGFRQRI